MVNCHLVTNTLFYAGGFTVYDLRRHTKQTTSKLFRCIVLRDYLNTSAHFGYKLINKLQTLIDLAAGLRGGPNAVALGEVPVEVHAQAGGARHRPSIPAPSSQERGAGVVNSIAGPFPA